MTFKITPILKIENLSKVYQSGTTQVIVLNEINFQIEAGEFLTIEGPSGSGKTTLLNLIGGLDRPTAGRILFENQDINKSSPNQLASYRSKEIGFVFQFFNLMPHLTALENVLLPKMFLNDIGKGDLERANNLLEKVGLEKMGKRKPSELSGGERQRVAIARALMNKPKALLLDEPTGNLDARNTKDIFQLLEKLNQEDKTTIIIATHDIEIENYAKRILRLKKEGKIYED